MASQVQSRGLQCVQHPLASKNLPTPCDLKPGRVSMWVSVLQIKWSVWDSSPELPLSCDNMHLAMAGAVSPPGPATLRPRAQGQAGLAVCPFVPTRCASDAAQLVNHPPDPMAPTRGTGKPSCQRTISRSDLRRP